MHQWLPDPEMIAVGGVLLGILVAAFVLSRQRVGAYIRAATWLRVLSWWLLVALVWVPLLLGPGFQFGGPAWLWVPLGFVLGVALHVLIVGAPLFAIAATLICWTSKRRRSAADITARGA